MPFEELPHTGDLAYRVTAPTREKLFAEAARALFSTITDLEAVEEGEERTIASTGSTDQELLIEFLRACLDLFATGEFVAASAAVTIGEGKLQSTLKGERFDPSRHPFKTEIKAVTYHGAEVEERNGKWEAVFTLDL